MRFLNPKEAIGILKLAYGQRVVDLGAGSGHYVFEAARAVGEAGTVYAIDIQNELVRHVAKEARLRRLANVEAMVGDLESDNGSGLPDNCADAVIVSNTLFQVEHKDTLIREAVRVLKNNGKLLIIDWKESYKGLGPQPEHIVKASDIKKIAEGLKCTLLEEIDPGAHHYRLLFKK